MAGLTLGVGGFGSGIAAAKLPIAANAPSSTISQKAFGVTTGTAGLSRVPAYGTLTVGVAAAAVLVWLWYSLPR